MPNRSLDADLIPYAILGLQQRKAEIEAELERLIKRHRRGRKHGTGTLEWGISNDPMVTMTRKISGEARAGRRKGRKMSAAARRRISQAQKERWRKHRAKVRA